MGVSYKMILNLPDMRLMENKKNLKREFPSRKSKKKLSSHHLSFPEEVQKVNSKALLLLPESHPWGCRRSWWAKTLYTSSVFLGPCVLFSLCPAEELGTPDSKLKVLYPF